MIGDKAVKVLAVVVIAGAVAVLGGAGALVYLLAQGKGGQRDEGRAPAATSTPATGVERAVRVPPGFRARQVDLREGQVIVLGAVSDGGQVVIIVDPRKPEAAAALRLEPGP